MSTKAFVQTPGVYLLNHAVGLPPVNAKEQFADDFFDPWAQGNDTIWTSWLNVVEGFRQAIGQLLNANPSDICPQSNLSSALTKLLMSLPCPPKHKNTILLSEEDFPSLGFALEKARDADLTLKFLPSDVDCSSFDAWREYLDGDVYIALFTHVQSNNGTQLPIAQLTEYAREQNIISVVDVAQSAGVVPIDVSQWQADVILGSCVKWLCGGPGAGYIWIDPDRLKLLEPRDVGWFSHDQPFEYDIHHFRYANDALRFWGGTPTVAPYAIASNSLQVLLDIGIDNISAHNYKCKQFLLQSIPPELTLSPADSAHQGGTLIIKHSDHLEKKLREAQVHFDIRQPGIRLSPHIYNTIEQLQTVLGCFNR